MIQDPSILICQLGQLLFLNPGFEEVIFVVHSFVAHTAWNLACRIFVASVQLYSDQY